MYPWTTNSEPVKVTVELGRIVEQGVNIWDFNYPSFYTGKDKETFEQKVIDHFYFRQIGQETVGRFLHMFHAKVREIMPYYIKLYDSIQVMENIDDIFGNVDMVEETQITRTSTGNGETSSSSEGSTSNTLTETNTGTGTVTESGNRETERRFSNTPQGSIENLDNFLTEATKENETTGKSVETSENGNRSGSNTGEDSSTTTATTTTNSTDTETHRYTRKGNHGVNTYAHDMREYREIILNIDMMIINDLNPLFLGVY